MKVKFNWKLAALCGLLSAALVSPALGESQGDMAKKFKEQRSQMIKKLKLAPEKEKAMMALEDKYGAERKDLFAGLKKSRDELQAALAAPKPDEAKIKDLVTALTSGQEKVFASFKSQRDEELALMTPVEQGKYLMEMWQWHQEMMKKHQKK